MKKPYKCASFRNETTGEVRHLLIVEQTEQGFTYLICFSAGNEGEPLAQGQEFETLQKADEWGKVWVSKGFKRVEPAYEPLEHAVKLAKRLGRTDIFDSPVSAGMRERYNGKKIQLDDWESTQAKNGAHKYAVTSSGITAAPQPSGKTIHFPFADPTAI